MKMNASPVIWFNGELVSANELGISPFDLGLTVGLGLFETMPAYHGKVFGCALHHARLVKSAVALGLKVPDIETIQTAVEKVILANDLGEGRSRVRVTVTGGANPLHGGEKQGAVMVSAVAIEPSSADEIVRLVWVPYVVNERSATTGTKSTSYADHVLAYRCAREAGADEALMLNTRGRLAEGSMSNVFLVRDGVVLTPPLASGCLPGVTRQLVIGLCADLNVPFEERDLDEQDVLDADEIFLTSSLREVQPAGRLDDDSALAGSVTQHLAEAYAALVRKEVG